MPLYEYQCLQCSERVELIQKMSDPPPAACAKCGGGMKKLFSSPAIQFKGSGFYKTDYASTSSAAPSSAAAPAAGGSSGESSAAKSDSSPASSSSDSSSSSSAPSSPAPAKAATKSDL